MIELFHSIKHKYKTRKINRLINNNGDNCILCMYSKYNIFGLCLKFSMVSDPILSIKRYNSNNPCVYRSHYRNPIVDILNARGREISSEY